MQRRLTRKSGFVPITLNEYIKKHLVSNPGVDAEELKTRLRGVLAAKEAGESREEVSMLIQEAIELHIEDLKAQGKQAPSPHSSGELVSVDA